MGQFDLKAFSSALMDEVQAQTKPEFFQVVSQVHGAVDRIGALAKRTEDTLQAIALETDPVRLANLKDDLATFLPAERLALVSLAKTQAGSAGAAILEAVLLTSEKMLVVVAKSFVPGLSVLPSGA